jgi:hypothetical protein
MSASAPMGTIFNGLYSFTQNNLKTVSFEQPIFMISGFSTIKESWQG